jgi:WD40 repeat protein
MKHIQPASLLAEQVHRNDGLLFPQGEQPMILQKAITGLGAIALAGTGLWAFGLFGTSASSGSGRESATPEEKKKPPVVAKPLVAQAAPRQGPKVDPNRPSPGFAEEPIVIADCRLNVIYKTEIAAQREGLLLFIGRPIEPRENVPADRLDTYQTKERVMEKEKAREGDKLVDRDKVVKRDKKVPYYRLKEGDRVDINDMLALVDNRLAIDEKTIKEKKLVNAQAELQVSIATRDEAYQRHLTQLRLERAGGGPATSKEDVRAAELAYKKYVYEVVSKEAAIKVAESELNQTDTVVEMHEIRNKIPGQVVTIYKKKGEAVKSLEPVMLIRNLDRLRAEGMADVQDLARIHKGSKVLIEPARKSGHYEPLIGHTQAITGVAVSKDPGNPLIASSSEDGTVRIWRPGSRTEYRIYYHWLRRTPLAVRSVACTPPGAAANWCLTGANDGSLRLWDLDADLMEPLRVFDGGHRGPVNCLAFNSDATLCASGGGDNDIRIWDPSTGLLKARLTDHHGAIQSLQFTPQGQLVSTAKDQTIMIWNIGDEPRLAEAPISRRSGEVPVLGVSPDGKKVLYDPWQSKYLQVLSLPERLTTGVIRNPAGTAGFKTLALFSPDGKLVLTGTPTEGTLQLWKAPTETSRAYEVRELGSKERFRSAVTCAAFYPHAPEGRNNGFVVAGTKDRQVLVWPLPSPKEVDEFQIPGEVSYIERSLDASAHQVRIWADFQNPKDPNDPDGYGLLMPGDIVNVVVPPATNIQAARGN